MTKTIAQLWNGSLEPIKCLGKNNLELKQLEKLMQRNLEMLEETLNQKAKEILKKYNDCINEYIIVNSEQAFCDGFCAKTTTSA